VARGPLAFLRAATGRLPSEAALQLRVAGTAAKPVSWLVHPLLRRWLPGSVQKELALAKQELER
jgi:hypothetical protein